jgi:glycine/D-amino acid oxidase-like deaminating enzyme
MKTSVLIAYPFTNGILNNEQIIYLPELVENEISLQMAIRQYHPEILIVGNNSVGSSTLQLWRLIMTNDIELTIIRRGSSLSRIDLICSKELKIKVLNTLSVNSRFVVEYIIEHLHLSNNNNEIISIIGSGAIGGRIADRLNKLKYKINIYSPSLTNPDEFQRKKIAKSKGIGSSDINISMTPEQTLENATHVIIAIDADKVTNKNQQLSKAFFQLIKNGSRIVSVTEFRVFEEGSIDIIIDRIKKEEITARLDSHPYDLSTIKEHLPGLETLSAAMKGPGCGQAMDQAALILLSNIILQKSFKSPLTFLINPLQIPEDITIIGAGILGLMTAFFLSENGYQVNIIDEHNCPYQNNGISNTHSPTLDGYDARHASITETMPHAVFYRKDSLGKYPSDHGGWRIIDTPFNNEEIKWMDKFNELAGYPELIVHLINEFISNINRFGIQLWEQIFEKYPEIVKDTVKNRRIIRICSSVTSLNVISSYQLKYHQNDIDNIQKLSHSQVLQKIPSLILKDGDAGGIEVPGFTINHQEFCINMIKYLERKKNVSFKWSNHIESINNINSPKIIFASSLNNLNLLSNVSLAIQGVLGCSIQIPNKHSIKIGFKITEKEPIGVINVTPSYDEQYLYITGAFAFTGQRTIVKSSYLNQLVDLFHSTLRSYLPEEMDLYESEMSTTKFCIRPMTPDGMPIIHKLSNEQNTKQDIYFIGGTNAGGFVQAPVLSTFILDLIKGQTNETDLSHIYRSLRLDRNTLIFN